MAQLLGQLFPRMDAAAWRELTVTLLAACFLIAFVSWFLRHVRIERPQPEDELEEAFGSD